MPGAILSSLAGAGVYTLLAGTALGPVGAAIAAAFPGPISLRSIK